MSDPNAHLAALEFFAGAGTITASPGGYKYQDKWRFSRSDYIGGVVSNRPVVSLQPRRDGAYIRGGIRVLRVGGMNGEGIGTLEAVNTTTLRWIAPGETTGDSIEVLNGETKILTCDTGGLKWIQVERTDAELLWGRETIQLSMVANNDVAGDVHLVEPAPWADTYIYRCVYVKNTSAYAITNLAITPASATTYVRQGTVTSGAGDSWATQDDGPVGGNPWAASLSGLSLGVGEVFQLGIRHKSAFVDDGAGGPDETMCTPRWTHSIAVSYSANGVDGIRDDLHGVGQRAIVSLRLYEAYGAFDVWPDVTDPGTYLWDTAATVSALSVDIGSLTPPNVQLVYYQILYRDEFGVRTPPEPVPYSILLSSSGAIPGPPDDPGEVLVTASALGVMRVQATYDAQFDTSGTSATDWLIYSTEDGTTPDPDVDTPTVVNIGWTIAAGQLAGGQVTLDWNSTALVDETPFKVIVRMRRILDGVTLDSSSTTVKSATACWYPAQLRSPIGGEMSGQAWQTGPDGIGETVTINAPNSVLLVSTDHGTELWAEGSCIWSLRADQLRHAYPFSIDTISGAASTANAMEIGTWDAGAKEIFINVAGQHVALIECVSQTIRFAQVISTGTPHERNASTPVWPCYAYTCFQVFNGLTGRWETPMSVDANGVLTLDVPGAMCSEAECLE